MKRIFFFLSVCAGLLASCSEKNNFEEAVAVWSFANVNDEVGANSKLSEHGAVQFVGEKNIGDGKAVFLDGNSWLNAEQGADGELNVTGKGLSIFVRMKADSVKEYNPILTKSGSDQNMAYSIALRKREDGVYIETMMGSDDIGGSHLLKYKLPESEISQWHDILLRFNGNISELFVNSILRDNEVTVGDTRDWNTRPVLIGAEFKQPYIHGDSLNNTIEHTFKGWIDCVAIWDKYLPDEKAAALSGLSVLNKDGLPAYYQEKYRPQFHFTAKKNWINDPNGLVYYNGEYHLFFQYMPPHRHGAYKDWGHAVSKDLIHWEQVPQHITPHKVWGGCWSGSAVVDVNNVSGFQTGAHKPILAFITNGGNPNAGYGPKNTQNIAYSIDGGTTFTYYDQNPIIENIHEANRDPKVVWDEDSKQWVMSLYMDKGYDFGIFTSTNLRDWKQTSTLTLDRIAECPGFEPFVVDGSTSSKKWVFFGANGNYVVGTFDGKQFLPETGTIHGEYGNNFYAAQTWDNAPDGRRIQIGWMPTNKYPGMPFEQQMNFPNEVSLKSTQEGLRLFRMPIAEIKNLYDSEIKWKKSITNQTDNPLKDLKGDTYDFSFEIDLLKSNKIDIGIRGATIQYDVAKKILRAGGSPVQSDFPPDKWKSFVRTNVNESNNLGEATLYPINGKIKLRILVDRTTIEIFANDGRIAITSNFMPTEDHYYHLTTDGEANVAAEIHSIKSIWKP